LEQGQELLGMAFARQRPQPLARTAGQDDWNNHRRTLVIYSERRIFDYGISALDCQPRALPVKLPAVFRRLF
jgi:hypothetical protein